MPTRRRDPDVVGVDQRVARARPAACRRLYSRWIIAPGRLCQPLRHLNSAAFGLVFSCRPSSSTIRGCLTATFSGSGPAGVRWPLTTAGGLELLRSVLQEFTKLKQRLHVTLAGCVGRAPYGDPFQFVAETLSDLKHDFAFVLSNDPMVLLDALDGTALIMVADRLALRTPTLDLLRARGLPVLDLTPTELE